MLLCRRCIGGYGGHRTDYIVSPVQADGCRTPTDRPSQPASHHPLETDVPWSNLVSNRLPRGTYRWPLQLLVGELNNCATIILYIRVWRDFLASERADCGELS